MGLGLKGTRAAFFRNGRVRRAFSYFILGTSLERFLVFLYFWWFAHICLRFRLLLAAESNEALHFVQRCTEAYTKHRRKGQICNTSHDL